MNRILKGTGLLVWGIGIYFLLAFLVKRYMVFARGFLLIFGLVSFIALIAFISFRIFYGKTWLLKAGKSLVVGSNLVDATNNFLEELPKPQKETIANLVGQLVYRFTRIGIIGLIVAGIPTVLLWNQNRLLDLQNKRIDQQTYLLEAERRSSLSFIMGNVLEKIDDEIDAQRNLIGNETGTPFEVPKEGYALSDQLIGRIISLTQGLKPYRYLESDTMIASSLSPERGQLLLALINSNISEASLDKIYAKSNFTFADLKGANLDSAYLQKIDLRGADVSNTTCNNANFEKALLTEANLSRMKARYARFVGTNLDIATMHSADFVDCNFGAAKMRRINCYKTRFYRTELGADIQYAKFKDSNFHNTSLKGSMFLFPDFEGSTFTGCDFTNRFEPVGDLNAIYRAICEDGDIHQRVKYISERGFEKMSEEVAECFQMEIVGILATAKTLYNCEGIDKYKEDLQRIKPGIFDKQKRGPPRYNIESIEKGTR